MKQNKVVTKMYTDLSDDWPGGEAVGVVEWFVKKITGIPNNCVHTAVIEIEGEPTYGDGALAKIQISYTRPETDEEESEREKSEADTEARIREAELQTLKELQEKYGTSNEGLS